MIQRTCVGCLQTDDHPKHLVAAGDTIVAFHMDCHAASEAGCESCSAQKDGAENLRGDEFRSHIVGLGEEFHQDLSARVNEAAVVAAQGGE